MPNIEEHWEEKANSLALFSASLLEKDTKIKTFFGLIPPLAACLKSQKFLSIAFFSGHLTVDRPYSSCMASYASFHHCNKEKCRSRFLRTNSKSQFVDIDVICECWTHKNPVVKTEIKTHCIDLSEYMILILMCWEQDINSILCPNNGYKIWRIFFLKR